MGEIDTCQLCMEGEVESQEHFFRKCNGLRHMSNRHGISEEVELEELLLFGDREDKDKERVKKYILDIWKEREKLTLAVQG